MSALLLLDGRIVGIIGGASATSGAAASGSCQQRGGGQPAKDVGDGARRRLPALMMALGLALGDGPERAPSCSSAACLSYHS
jgi:hypothetical protein